MKPDTKENIQYGTALIGLLTGVILCFLSFFLNNYNINGSVLGYLGEWIIFTSGVFGFSLYIKTKFLEAESKMDKKIEDEFDKIKEKEYKKNNKEEDEIVDSGQQ